MQCCRNPRYSLWYQLVCHLCLFDPLAPKPVLMFIFSDSEKHCGGVAHSDVGGCVIVLLVRSRDVWAVDGHVRLCVAHLGRWVTNIQKLS